MENEAQENRNEAPSRKRLLTVPKPKESFVIASPESDVSSFDRFAKKTRELPNLSDCHGCGARCNYINPRERLQPLDSMWRVVLLCKRCTKRIKSSEVCPYCFLGVVDENDCFNCRDCQHSIHKDCVVKYSWGLGFSVCVDCWVPEAVVNSVRLSKRKSRKKNKESCEPVVTLPESKISVSEISESDRLVKEVKRKVAAAEKTNENALRKFLIAKNAVELARGVVSAVASKKGAGNCELKAVDDVELAFMLRRAINSSPRFFRYACLMSSRRGASKKACLTDSSSLDVPLMCYSRRRRKECCMNSTSMDAQLMCCSRRRSWKIRECGNSTPSERIDQSFLNSSVRLKASNCGSMNIGTLDTGDGNFNGSLCQENDGERCDVKPACSLLKYHRVGKGIPRPSVFEKAFDCGSSMDSGDLNTESMNFGNGNVCHTVGEERCNESPNCFLLTYQRRSVRSKPLLSCKTEDRAPLLPSNCSVASRTFSDTRFQSSKQTIAFANASSREQV